MKRRIITAAALAFLLVAVGCETTGNVDRKADAGFQTGSGLVLFTVTHDKDSEHIFRTGKNVQLIVELRDLDKGTALRSAFSYDVAGLFPSSPFEDVWGNFYVRELPAGYYAFDDWIAKQNTGMGWNTFSPKKPVPPLTFEVSAGTVTYLGNVHGRLLWGKNIFGIDLLAGAVPVVRNEEQRDLALILKEYPHLRERVVVAPLRTGSWMPE